MPLEMSFLVSITTKNQYFHPTNFLKMFIIYYVLERLQGNNFLSSKLIYATSHSLKMLHYDNILY